MKKNYLLIILLLSTISFFCKKDSDVIEPVIESNINSVYIVNEGNFMKSNASLSLYLIDSNRTYKNIYESVNSKKLGDVAQNMYIKDGKGYIIINNSNKIVIIDIKTNKLTDTITTNLNSPRSIVFYSDKMFVSNLYGSTISVFGGTGYKTFIADIAVKSYPDEMMLINNKIYCLHSSGYNAPSTNISIIDPSANKVSKVIQGGYNPTMIKQTSANNAIVLCTGEYNDYADMNDDIYAKLFYIDCTNDKVTDSLYIGSHPMDFALDNTNYAYVIGDLGIMKVNTSSKKIENSAYISGYYYSIAIDPTYKYLYISDAGDYKSDGTVSIYNTDGTLKTKFTVGLIPGAFCFNTK